MNMAQEVSREVIAHDFIAGMHGKLDQDKIAEASKALMATQTAHSANGSVASLVFYLQFQVKVNGGKTFDGKAGGISTPGGGALFGNVYTDDLERLYRDTTSFEYQGTPVYLSVLFFDKHSTLLGHFQSGAVSTVTGVGGGSGHWS